MPPKYIGSIDQGTTSSRFLIFDAKGKVVVSHQEEFEQLHPRSGWHEHKPQDLISSVENCIAAAVEKFTGQGHQVSDIAAVGITNQRETFVLWDSRTDEILHNAIVWTDTRTSSLVRDLKAKSGAEKLQDLCGLPLSTYPSAVKLVWLLENDEKVRRSYDDGNLVFGTVDTWLLRHLTGEYLTDTTNASRTMLMNLRNGTYDDTLLSFFGLDSQKIKFPQIIRSSGSFGTVRDGPLKGLPVRGCLGDQSAALVGHLGFKPGQAKNTYGTGCFLLYNVGDQPVISKHGLLATVAYDIPFGDEKGPKYALEGSIAVAGSGVKFLVNNLGFGTQASDIGALAGEVQDSGGVIFVTAFSGLLAPYWIDDAQGTLFGITAHTQRAHIARATLDAVCFQTKAILDAMEKDSGKALQALAVDGGMSNSDECMQIQSDIIGIQVRRPAMRESTALGAAIAAGVGAGFWKDPETELGKDEGVDVDAFEVRSSVEERKQRFDRWNKAVEMAQGWT